MSRNGNRDFVRLWVGQAVSQLGSSISMVGLQFTAVSTLNATPREMGLLAAAGGVTILTVGLFAGAMADRMRRRPILISVDLARAVVLAAIPVLAWVGRLTMNRLYLAAALTGALTVLFDSAYRAYLPALVTEDELLSANSKLALSQSASEVGGPGLAGVLIQLFGAPVAILLDSVSFLWSAGWLAAIRKREPAPKAEAGHSHVFREIAEGLKAAWAHPILRAMTLRNATGAFFLGFIGGMYFLFVVRELGLSAGLVGTIISFGGSFSLAGSAAAQKIAARFGLGRAMIGAALATGVGSLLPGLAHGPVWVCVAFLAASQMFDIGWSVYGIGEATLIQTIAPPELLGRVSAAVSLLFRGVIPIGSVVAGLLAERISLRGAMLVGGAGYLLSAGWLVRCGQLREWRQPSA